jgi:pyruvate ferredoxin oxidoreductase alpha subunit
MAKYMMLDGNAAAVQAIKMARVKVISAYPITPQSSIAEKLSDLVQDGSLDARYLRVESEHTAMSAAIGAQLTGVRAATATSSVGLALMHEVLNVASGCRVPIVMPVVNRALVAPWSLWCDHQDTMAERDSGWLQFYCENVQDVFDYVIMGYKIAEHEDVLTPIMICLDGFFLSHSMQKVLVPKQNEVDEFIGDYARKNAYLDPTDPIIINNLTPSDEFTEMRYQQKVGFDNASKVMDKVFLEFKEKFGRTHRAVEGYKLEDAEAVIVTLGSISGTAKQVVNELRNEGKKVGVLKIVSFRPFRNHLVNEMLKGIKRIAVFDRTAGLGSQGAPLWHEVKNSLEKSDAIVKSYIGGLGGRDVSEETIRKVFMDIMDDDSKNESLVWIDLKENAMDIRQVFKRV